MERKTRGLRTLSTRIARFLGARTDRLTLRTKRTPVGTRSEADVLAHFRDDPGRFLKGYSESDYPWPAKARWFQDMYFREGRFDIGYIQRIASESKSRLIVGHFAIAEPRLARRGIGRAMAGWLRDEIGRRYPSIEELVFAETSLRPHDREFFEAIGARFVGVVDYCERYSLPISGGDGSRQDVIDVHE